MSGKDRRAEDYARYKQYDYAAVSDAFNLFMNPTLSYSILDTFLPCIFISDMERLKSYPVHMHQMFTK